MDSSLILSVSAVGAAITGSGDGGIADAAAGTAGAVVAGGVPGSDTGISGDLLVDISVSVSSVSIASFSS